MKFLIDSHAWIEYFKGTAKGNKVKEIIENKNNDIFTIDVCLAEIKYWTVQEKTDFVQIYTAICSNSEIIECLSNDWIETAEIKFEQRKKIKDFGLVDAMLLVKQKQNNLIILTGDKHFAENPKAILI